MTNDCFDFSVPRSEFELCLAKSSVDKNMRELNSHIHFRAFFVDKVNDSRTGFSILYYININAINLTYINYTTDTRNCSTSSELHCIVVKNVRVIYIYVATIVRVSM